MNKIEKHFLGYLIPCRKRLVPFLAFSGTFAIVIGWLCLPPAASGWTVTRAAAPQSESATKMPTLYLIGDSTVKNGSGEGADGLWGWGDLLATWLDKSKIRIENRARGGRSSRTYQTEGLWNQVLSVLKPGDYVLVQFGHNDGGPLNTGRARASLQGIGEESQETVMEATGKKEAVYTYGWYLRKYITDTKAKGAVPVILSPVPRNMWSEQRTVLRASNDYGRWAAEVAKAEGVPFLDLNEIVAKQYEEIGPEKVKALYFLQDHTHTNLVGAQLTAALVVQGLRKLQDSPLVTTLLPKPEPFVPPVVAPKTLYGTVSSADGVSIRYEVRGGQEPALVFIHCWCCDRTYWEKQLPFFAQRHKVVALDLAGHGESGLDRMQWGPKTYAQDVKAVVDKLELKKVILIGHSMGGPVAAQTALLLADRVLAIIGVDTFNDLEQKPDQQQVDQVLAAMRADFPKATEEFIRGMMFQPNTDPRLVDRIAKDMSQGPANVGIASMEGILKQDLPAVLEQAKVPVYCVNADKFPTNTAAGQRHAPLFKVRILPGTGHFLELEKPVEFNKLLEETINEIIAGYSPR